MNTNDTTTTAEQGLPPVAGAWLDAWNGDLDRVPDATNTTFTAHAAPLTGGAAATMHGRDALTGWITGIHQVLDDLAFVIEVGPIIADPYMVIRWRADGRYAGGLPHTSADAIDGHVTFYGTDTLRIMDGRIEEYWANADSAWFLQQIGLTHLPSLTTTAQLERPPA